ncbi:GTPase domain-containing protein [Candidatus Saccharibacteria bacterium]|nr:GTPase domain-containing protein [Candidatus Saccharibacteria bacterium]
MRSYTILVLGAPGTGKTSFIRAIANEQGVAELNTNKGPISIKFLDSCYIFDHSPPDAIIFFSSIAKTPVFSASTHCNETENSLRKLGYNLEETPSIIVLNMLDLGSHRGEGFHRWNDRQRLIEISVKSRTNIYNPLQFVLRDLIKDSDLVILGNHDSPQTISEQKMDRLLTIVNNLEDKIESLEDFVRSTVDDYKTFEHSKLRGPVGLEEQIAYLLK